VCSSDLGMQMTLVNSDGVEIATAVANAAGLAQFNLKGALAGGYFIRVAYVPAATAPTFYDLILMGTQAGALQLGRDRTDMVQIPNNTIDTAFGLPAVQGLGRVTGLTIHSVTDTDVFRFELDRKGVAGDRINLLKSATTDQIVIEILDAAGTVIRSGAAFAPLVDAASIEGLDAGTYFVRVRHADVNQGDAVTLAAYELVFQIPLLREVETSITNA